MKNLYLLPTDKPSRLHDYNYISLLGLSKEYLQWRQGKHIYITSNEKIKEGDWIKGNVVGYNDTRIEKATHNDLKYKWNKIILTTDQDLIKDGVQAILDEFLEWFVKNHSCENVETKHIIKEYVDDQDAYGYDVNYYKIIISKEKPKQDFFLLTDCFCKKPNFDVMKGLCKICGNSIIHLGKRVEVSKQETLKEAAESFTKNNSNETDLLLVKTIAEKVSFIGGAKWQQERSYSEEDMLEASKYGYNFHKTTQFPSQEFEESCIRNTQQWLTIIKKK
jgi:hypothetical protein